MSVQLGDPTLNALEIWGAEYQESNALLLRPSDRDFLSRASARERCPACFVGTITGDKKVSCHQQSRVDAVGRLGLPECVGLGEKCWRSKMRSSEKCTGGAPPGSQTGQGRDLFSYSLGRFPASVQDFIFFFFFRGCPWGPQIVLVDDRECLVGKSGQGDAPHPTPVNLDLDWVLGKMPQKVCEPGRGCILQWPFWHTDVPLPLFVTSVPCPSQVLTFGLLHFRSSSSRENPLCCSLWLCPQS